MLKFALFAVPRSTTLPCMSNRAYLSPTRAPATCRLRFITLTLNCGTGICSNESFFPLLEELSDFPLELDFALEEDFAELDDFAELELDFAEELLFALLLETLDDDFTELLLDFGGSAEELDATLDDDSLELDATELLEGASSQIATRLTSSVALKEQ